MNRGVEFFQVSTIIAGVILLCLAMIQIVHIFFLSTRQTKRPCSASLVYESLLDLCLVGYALRAFDIQLSDLAVVTSSPHMELCLNVLTIIWGVVVLARYYKWIIVPDTAALLLMMSLGAKCLTGFVELIASVCLVYFMLRITITIAYDYMYRKNHIMQLSIMESMKKLPDGILCSDIHGDVLFMNDKMRFYLEHLGIPADLSDANMIRKSILAKGTELIDEEADFEPASVSTCVSLGNAGVSMFTFDAVEIHRHLYKRVIAYDATEKMQLAGKIEAANTELKKSAAEILESIERLKSIAETQALLHMCSRVHDIIGQRLSLVHRLLESYDFSDESIQQMPPLLNGILDDLLPSSRLDPEEELLLMKSTLRMTGISLSIQGNLPEDESVAHAMVSIVREAATNAVRHAQALNIDVQIRLYAVGDEASEGLMAEVVVTNDGCVPTHDIQEGSGIMGMRHTVESRGGFLIVLSHPQFKICAKFPMNAQPSCEATTW